MQDQKIALSHGFTMQVNAPTTSHPACMCVTNKRVICFPSVQNNKTEVINLAGGGATLCRIHTYQSCVSTLILNQRRGGVDTLLEFVRKEII